ncbi:MAG: aminoacyl-tRNA hydrolase [bacterium]|nr:aminoacyl-tRNA hydrolase [bacterium]
MYLVAGLGNPGREYEMTRHNIGFITIDYLADKYNVKVNKLKYKALYGETRIGSEKVLLIKPQTYMNNSGESLMDFVNFFKVPIENLIVISDDVSLDYGRIRVRGRGSAGGHNGLKSIIYLLNSDSFPRVKIGVGAPEHDMVNHVLGRFPKEKMPAMEDAVERAMGAVEEIINKGVPSAMNKFNGTGK